MEEQINQQTSSVRPPSNNPIAIIVAIVLTALIAGGGVYFWQTQEANKLQEQINNINLQLETTQKNLQDQIDVEKENAMEIENAKMKVENEKMELEKKYCTGTWNNGVCITTTCVDSDVNEKPDDIYIKGSVTYTNSEGVPTTVYDECSGPKLQVNEMWCYESPKGSNNYVQGRMVYDCPNGCLDGACIK